MPVASHAASSHSMRRCGMSIALAPRSGRLIEDRQQQCIGAQALDLGLRSGPYAVPQSRKRDCLDVVGSDEFASADERVSAARANECDRAARSGADRDTWMLTRR